MSSSAGACGTTIPPMQPPADISDPKSPYWAYYGIPFSADAVADRLAIWDLAIGTPSYQVAVDAATGYGPNPLTGETKVDPTMIPFYEERFFNKDRPWDPNDLAYTLPHVRN